MAARVVALYDANVLYPAQLRDLLIRLAVAGLVRAHWTDAIHDEWTRHVLADHPDITRAHLLRTRRLMDAALPAARVDGYAHHIPRLTLPSDLIMTTEDAQGHLQDLLVVTVGDAGPQEYWRVDDVPTTLGLSEDVQFIGFADPFGGGVRHGVFVGNLSVHLVDPHTNALRWADDNGVPSILGAVLDLTNDGVDDLILYLPDTEQVQVWSIN